MTEIVPGVLCVRGTATQRVPLVFDSPHSGTDYPPEFDHAVDPHALRWAEDTHVADLWSGALASGAVLQEALFPRSFIDANRAATDIDPAQLDGDYPHPLAPSVKSTLGIGLCWTRVPPGGEPLYARRLTAAEVLSRVDRYHRPYQTRLRALLDASHARWGGVWHVNCHSMQNVASAMSTQARGTPRPDFLLSDRDGASCEPGFTETIRACLATRGYTIAINDPYKGMELIRTNGDPAANRHSMQIEVNRALYMTEATREPNAGYAALQACFTDLAAHLAAYVTTRIGAAPAP